MEIKATEFDYGKLDGTTAGILRRKEEKMRDAVGRAYTDLGQQLKEAQDVLAKYKHGCFEEWYTSLGFKKRTVYNLIQRYDLIVQNLEERNLLEELPTSLTYEISKPSTDPELKQKVLDGDITTLKQLKEAEARASEAERTTRFARLEIEGYKRELKSLREQAGVEGEAPHIEPVEIEKIVEVEKIVEKEVVPEDYQSIKRKVQDQELELERLQSEKEHLERKAKLNEDEADEYKALKQQIQNLKEQKNSLSRQIESATELSGLVVRVESLLKKDLAPIKYSRAIREQGDDPIVKENLTEIVDRLREWCREMEVLIGGKDYIDAEVIEDE